MNGFMHGSQGLQARPNQAEFLANGALADRHNLMMTGIGNLESQQRNVFDCHSGVARSSDRSEVPESPVSYDFLGSQQPFMRNPNPPVSHPRPIEQPGYGDVQFLQQQLLYRQLQEMQRQQQLAQGGRPQNQFGNLPGSEKLIASMRLPSMLGGMHVQNAPNRIWSNEPANELKVTNNSQMLVAGNMNWPQYSGPPVQGYPNGFVFSNENGQNMSSGVSAQQFDNSLYGTPIRTTRGPMNYSPFEGTAFDCNEVAPRAAGEQVQKPDTANFQSRNHGLHVQDPLHGSISNPKQVFDERSAFGNATAQGVSGVGLQNLQQEGYFSQSIQVEDMHEKHVHGRWAEQLQQKPEALQGSGDVTILDSSEEKLLFRADDDSNWNCHVTAQGYLHDNPLEFNQSGFPSVQSGSWSALVQEALGASSSDSGVQEEWGGLSFSQKEQLSDSQAAGLDDQTKQQLTWDDNNIQHVSSPTSRAFPFLSGGDKNSPHHSTSNFQHESTKFSYEQDESARQGSSHEPSPHSANKRQLSIDEQKESVGGSLQVQMPFGKVPSGIWQAHVNQQSLNSSPDTESNAQSVHTNWHLEHRISLPSNASHSGNKGNFWNMNEISSPGRESSRDVHDVDVRAHYACSSNLKSTEMDYRPTLMNPNASPVIKEFDNKHQGDFRKYVVSNTPINLKVDGESNRNTQVFGSAITGKTPSQPYDNRQENSTTCTYKVSHPSQYTDGGTGAADSRITVNDTLSPLSCNQNLTGQSCRKTPGPSRFQYQLAEDFGANVDSQNRTLNSQAPSQLFMKGWKNQEQRYVGLPQSASHVANNAAGVGKRHSYELHKIAEEAEGRQSLGLSQNSSPSASLDGSTPHFTHKQISQGSQNMLELLHKVDGKSDNITPTLINRSDRSSFPLPIKGDPREDISSSRSSVSQEFGLGLGPPVPVCSGAGQRDQTLFCSTDDASPKNNWNGATMASIKAGKETAQISGNYTSVVPVHPYARSPQHNTQQQRISSSTGLTLQSSRSSVGNPLEAKEQLRNDSYAGQMRESNFGHIGDQSAQASLSTSRVFPSRLASSSDHRAGAASQLDSLTTGLPQPLHPNVASNMRTPDQQPSVVEPYQSPQSALSGVPQVGGFSTMLKNMWTNVSAQRQLSAVNTERTAPTMLHPTNSLFNSRVSGYMPPSKADNHCNRSKTNIPPEPNAAPPNAYHSPKLEESETDSGRQPIPSDRAHIDPKFGALSQVQRTLLKQGSEVNLAVSIPALVRMHEQELGKGKRVVDMGVGSQTEHTSFCDSGKLNHDDRTSAIISKLSDTPNNNYSLLQQMRSMKPVDSDFGKSAEERPGNADLSNEATQVDRNVGQTFAYGENTPFRHSSDGKYGPATQQGTFTSGVNMLRFSPNENEDNTTKMSTSRETSTLKLPSSAQNDLQNRLDSPNTMPTLTTSGGNGLPQFSPSMAPTWFNHYENYKNAPVLTTYNSLGSSQYSSKVAPLDRAAPEIRLDSAIAVQRHDSTLADSLLHNTVVAMTASSHPSNFMKSTILRRPKKRKNMASDLVPWGKQIVEASEKLLDIREIEGEWAYAANRLVEKVDDEFDALEEGSLLTRSKRRLVLATLLVQQLLSALPARLLREKTLTSYESVTYFVSKSTLSDACSLVCHLATNSFLQSDRDNKTCKRIKTSENERENVFLKVADNFIGRTNKLESELLRLDKKVSMLDLKMECQDLERCSIINRFAKFHGRPQNDGAEGSLRSESIVRRIFPQRQAIMLPFPRNVPEGAFCLSL